MFIKGLQAALLAAALGSTPASSAVLWFGGEDTSGQTASGTVNYDTAVTTHDANLSRTAAVIGNTTSTSDPPTNRQTSPTVTAGNVLWFHAHISVGVGANNNTTNNEQAIWMASPDAVGRVYLRQNGTAGTLKLSTANAARTFTDVATATGTISAQPTSQHDLDWVVTFDSGSTVYLDGVVILTYSGDLRTDAATTLDRVVWASVNNGANNSAGTCWSEWEIATTTTISDRVRTLVLQAAGNTQGWTPSTLANVNKSLIADGTFVSDATGNVLSQWTVPTAAPTGTWGVKSVSIEARLLRNVLGPQNFDWSWRISNADYLAGTTTAATASFANYRLQQDTSPATSATWGITEVFNTSTNQMNIGIKSLP